MTFTKRSLLALAVTSLLAIPISAQVPTGTPPFGSFGGGPDVINLANLNSHIVIPVLHKAGRGTNFAYDLSYDSSVWYPSTSSGTNTWTPVYNWGWAGQTQIATGYLAYNYGFGGRCSGSGGSQYFDRGQYSGFKYNDAYGTSHKFPGFINFVSPPCTPALGGTLNVNSTDGSGYNLQVTVDQTGNITSLQVYSSNGTQLNPPQQINSGPGSFTDRNGNQITVNTNGQFFDTLSSTTPVLTVAGSGTPASPETFTYTAPSTGSAAYTMKFATYSIQTNFGCSGITDYGTNGTTTANLVSEIDLPDIAVNANDKYTFTYEATPGHAGFVTGRLASVKLPTGGTITYTYTGGSSGNITCADGSAATFTRTTPDGTWTYAQVKGAGPASTTTVTDPQGNQTAIQFQGIYETERQVYQGTTSGTLLKTTNICYNGNTSSCTSTAITLPITQRKVIAQLPGTNNFEAEHIFTYNANGSLTEQDDYDYGSGAPGALLKKTAITLAVLANISAFRQQVTVTNGAGTVISQTNYNYDQTSAAVTSGTPQHTAISGSRGNLTSINYYTQGSTYLTKSMTYFDTGNVQTVTDVNGAQTSFTYGACGNSFPTSIGEPLSLTRSMTWDTGCKGGAMTSLTDENSKTTSTSYIDAYFWRPASVTDPTSAALNYTYLDPTQAESVLSFNSGNSASDGLATLDTQGRRVLSQSRQAPGATNFDTIETDYDSLGRVYKITLPFTSTSGTTNSSAPGSTKTYDALSRVTGVNDSGGGTLTKAYSQNDVLVTRGPAPSGENTKRRQLERDGLGRLTSVCEITSGTTAWPGGTCAQNTSQWGYWTKYTYDALGHLTGVTQNAQASSTQSRTFSYDLMGRQLSETNPESGTTTYTYDTDSTCGTSDGDLVKRVDAVGNVNCYSYDALHRPLTITYPSGSYSSTTPQKHFVYDSATVNSIAMAYAKSRLAEAYTCLSPCTTKLTDIGLSYSVRGQPSDVYESTPHSGMYYHISETYWANGSLDQLGNNIASLPAFTYAPDGEGRPYQVSASSGPNPVTNTIFNSASLPTAITYGSSDADSYSYDSNTDRLTQYQFNVNGQSLTGALTWNANHTLGALNITDALNSADTQSCSFSHDDLTRLTNANCGSGSCPAFS